MLDPGEGLPLEPIGSSLDDLAAMPAEVRKAFGGALRMTQLGERPEGARPFGEGLPREIMKLVLMKMTRSHSPTAIRGNIFEALGLEDAPELQARVDLAVALTRESRRIIEAEGISQRALAERIGIDPGDLSRLMNGTVGEFSQERLARLLNQLGCEVKITVRRADGDHPSTTQVDFSELLEPVA